jgi:hypothetical protein
LKKSKGCGTWKGPKKDRGFLVEMALEILEGPFTINLLPNTTLDGSKQPNYKTDPNN